MRHMRLCLVLALFSVLACVHAAVPSTAYAAGTFTVDDQAMLLTSAQEDKLRADYSELTVYVDTAFVSTKEATNDVEEFAHAYVNSNFNDTPAVIFVIDMHNRQICVYANKAGLKYVSEADARAITDGIYQYASMGDYYGCADAAFGRMLDKCQGRQISNPVKHITNLLIAVVFGVLVNFFVLYHSRAKIMRQRASSESMRGMASLPTIVSSTPTMTNRVRHYRSSGSSGGHGGGGHGGGGGGGGGSHRF